MDIGLSTGDWIATLSLIFGGCCSNAITLEQLTSEFSHAGILITFVQFLVVVLYGLTKNVVLSDGKSDKVSDRPQNGVTLSSHLSPRAPWLARISFRPRRVPIPRYLIHVVLFYAVSTLNNIAFQFRIPMTVHIIFRSGGLVVNLLLGWLIAKKNYTSTQVISVLVVTIGIVLTTLSASGPRKQSFDLDSDDISSYTIGILILALALLMSGFLGLIQDWTFAQFVGKTQAVDNTSAASKNTAKGKIDESSHWQESMFYLHFLSLPFFLSSSGNIIEQLYIINNTPQTSLALYPSPLSRYLTFNEVPFINIHPAYILLFANAFTQLICVSGVNRLTGRISSLSVTFILTVRKAVSLILSVAIFGGRGNTMTWIGAALVFSGTIGYSLGVSRDRQRKDGQPDKKD